MVTGNTANECATDVNRRRDLVVARLLNNAILCRTLPPHPRLLSRQGRRVSYQRDI
jgi:hypothetical protein